jgi:predicted MFS family arabinose efflux permease
VTQMMAAEAPAPAATAPSFPGYSTKPYRAWVMFVLMVIYGFNLADRGLVALLQERIKPEFHLSDFELGLLGGPAFALFNALAGLPIARVSERFNRIGVLAICTALWSAMTVWCGLASSFPAMLLARFGVGVGEAGCMPSTQSVISDYFPAKARASAISLHLTAIPIGTIAASAIAAVIADLYGWRMAFVAIGAPGILVAVLCWLTVKEPPRGGGAAEEEKAPGFAAAMKEIAGKKSFFHVALATGLVNFVAVGNGQYIVSFLLRTYHIPLTQVGLVLGPVIGTISVVSVIVVGRIISRLAEKDRAWLARWPGIGVAIGVPVSLCAYMAPSFPIMLGFQIVGLLCTNAYLISLYTTAQGVVPVRMRATAAALVIMVANVIGYGLGPPAIGALSDFLQAHVVAFGLSDAAHASSQGLRYALMCGALVNLWAAVHYLIGSRHLKREWVG